MICPHCGSATDAEARFCGACGRATSATEPSYRDLSGPAAGGAGDLVGREIAGRYRVVAKLGEGGMGAVYQGEQLSLKRKVAIKVLRPELSADPGLVRRFNSEAELVAKLSHPNTVNIYDFGQDPGGALFIAMEYLEGQSLRQAVTTEGPLAPLRALAIARQIASSLSDAHGHGIVHRDLKPDNVMLTGRGKERDVVRVLDFGIAKLRDDNRATVNAMTRAGDLVGTPQYMAPEQIRGESVDGRTDVYALGAILYEMITARLPFEGTTVMAILSKHLTETPPAPSVRRPDLVIAPALDALVMAALAKDPAARPASMDGFADDMLAVGQGLGGSSSAGFGTPSGPLSAQQGAAGASAAFAVPSNAGFGPPGPPPVGAAPSYPQQPSYPAGNPGFAAPPPSYPAGNASFGAPGPTPAPMPLAHGPYPPAPMGYPPPHLSTLPVHRRSGSTWWLWVLAGVVVVGGVVATLLIANGKKKDDDQQAEPAPVPDVPGPTPVDDWQPDREPDPAPDPDSEWMSYANAGWSIEVPPGFAREPVVAADGTHSFIGVTGGLLSMVNIVVVASDGDPSEAQLEQASAKIASDLSARIVERGWVDTDGTRTYHAIAKSGTQTGELRFFPGDGVLLVAMYMRDGSWEPFAAERTKFFESVSPP